MKQRNLIKLVTVGLVLGAAINITSPSTAQQRPVSEYFCGTDKDGVPATMIQLREGSLPVIRWVRDFAPDSRWTPPERCRQVSLKFKQNQQSDNLRYIVPGKSAENGLPVLCAARQVSSHIISCPDAQILMTLRDGARPQDYIDQIAEINVNPTSGPINDESSSFVCTSSVVVIKNGRRICPEGAVRGIDMGRFIMEGTERRNLIPTSPNCVPGVLGICQ
jgi:hypothetical protein